MIRQRSFTLIAGTALAMAPLTFPISAMAQQEDASVRFSAPAWPGVTVKTAMASALLEALGYRPSQQEISATITYEALNLGEVDAFLAAWLPGQQSMYDPTMEKGNLVDLGNNVDGARLGFAVPRYVAEAGVTSAEDLDKEEFAERFDRIIYNIEAGSGMSEILNGAVDEDIYGLGDWDLSETSTPGMLSVVKDAISNDEWVVFGAWTPHWMNIEYDIVYLDDPEDLWGPDSGSSDVRTLLNKSFAESHPNARKFLDQLTISSEDQSKMIMGFGYEEREPEEVAEEWIKNNPGKIKAFAEGVTTRDGEPAWPALKQAFDLSDA
ncbi:glycine betaine/proline transport system substrate-binding protein [Modicisalibacter ilicicola DSM 19980]|uniref:Glycine betaine/proline transport system substrate-binding protein n=1 Tax=Modicisalibacter ilicicola DSM 19980 TaxID=1121942 RepID=A0A1M5EK40_9GAMM|nr:ABC transporter substrate-binding protein [Halomonas ilicicola]SHF79441.1 glycine betaine/proline transport system substrate-binding protein [Halomonas ilicicola DSM 19980]